ncbi:hypothetical protein [uncultured Kordia sp.]|uniref:hypothetical protein n=1 Tax=uncultured Kordia sp. TaxID=507699 RepID=UPI0026344324|nr:hypothetical protein [uncultured Kordia sp.]
MNRNLVIILFIFFLNEINSQVVDKRTGIQIFYEVHEDTFPVSWTTAEIAAKGISLDSTEIKRSLKIVKAALDKYPNNVITKNLKRVYILKSIEFYGEKFGGTNSSDTVYIANNGNDLGYSDAYLEKSFHHEFSSILLRNYPFYMKKDRWIASNKITYGDGGVTALKEDKSNQDFNSLLHAKGFLHQYATSSFENDFNSFAENLFLPSENFYATVELFPQLKNKLWIIRNFYGAIDKAFTKKYFSDLNSKNNKKQN